MWRCLPLETIQIIIILISHYLINVNHYCYLLTNCTDNQRHDWWHDPLTGRFLPRWRLLLRRRPAISPPVMRTRVVLRLGVVASLRLAATAPLPPPSRPPARLQRSDGGGGDGARLLLRRRPFLRRRSCDAPPHVVVRVVLLVGRLSSRLLSAALAPPVGAPALHPFTTINLTLAIKVATCYCSMK